MEKQAMTRITTWLVCVLAGLLLLPACAPAGGAVSTPTIIPVNGPGEGPGQPEATAVVTPTEAPPTATPIPFPSPTPTRTPMAPPATPTPANPHQQPAPAATPVALQAEVVSAGLNIRQGPGINYAVIGAAVAGDRFEVVGRNAAGAWLQIITAGGSEGWISGKADYTRVLGSLDEVVVIDAPAPPVGETTPARTGAATSGSSGSRLVFTSASGGALYVVDADGSNLRQIAGGVIDPAVSPDGQQVAFTRWDGAEFGALHVMNIDGTGERAVIGESRQAKSPTWSPDGREIVFSFQHGGLRDPEEQCKTYDADDGIRVPERAQITKTHFNRANGTITICFVRYEDLQWSLRRVNVQTGEFEDLPVNLYSYNPAWDPFNPWRLVYSGERGLMQVDLNTGQQQPLTNDLRDTGPVFSPDGTRLALTYRQHDHWEVYTLDLQTGERTRLTKPPILADPQYNSASPAWSPDGSQIAFLTDRTGRWEMWVMNADGSNQRPILPAALQAQLDLQYRGVHEQMLNWVN
jgi:Tol biopolymer transport system component